MLLSAFRPYRRTYLAGLALLVVTNGLSLTLPWLLRDAIHAIEAGTTLEKLGGYALLMLLVAMAQAWARTHSRLKMLGASRRVAFDIRNRFFSHLLRLGDSFYDRQGTGDIMSRGVNDLRLLRSLYGPGIMNVLNTLIVYSATLVLLLRIDPWLTFVTLVPFPVLFLAVKQISRRVYSRSMAVQEQLGAISNRAQENLSGIQQIKIFAQEDHEIAAFSSLCAEFRRQNLSMALLRGSMLSLIGIVSGVGTLMVLFVGGRQVMLGQISFGDFVAFNAYLMLLAWPTISMGWVVNVFQRGLGARKRLLEILDHQPDVPPAADEPRATASESLRGAISIRHLTFRYPGRQERDREPPLRDFNMEIHPGERVALVGAVGSGKSTLVNLLARRYPVPRGMIFLDGTDLNDLPTSFVRGTLGYVPQEAYLFSRTLRENITFGRPEASQEEIERVVEQAHLGDDLARFPDGLDTLVGERGYTLSGGQRQRATLARALLLEPSILILDDALSSVDADTEQAILAQLMAAERSPTCLLISHRVSTLVGADRIVVLESGCIVEEGTHKELQERNGVYRELFRHHLLEERLETS